MRTTLSWTPLLRRDGTRRDPTDIATGVADPDAAAFNALPREIAVADDAHPLAPPRIKQRPRRATSATATTAAKAATAAAAASARRRASTPAVRSSSAPVTSGGVDVSDYDPLVAAFGGASANLADRRTEGGASDDPLSQLWMPPQPPQPTAVAAFLGGEGDVGLADGAAAAPAVREALFDSVERDVKVAAAGLSDDPLSMMMQERAVASNMSRHGSVMMGGDLPGDAGSAPSAAAAEGSLAESEWRSARSSEAGGGTATATGGKGERGMSEGSGQEGGAGWGRQWEAHRHGILREFGEADILSGADKAGGPTPRPTTAPTPHAARLEELEGPAKGRGESGSGGGSGGGGGKKAKSAAGRGMAGGLLLTAEEYRTHVAGLKEELESAWAREEKVAALKVTVQAAKLLGDVSVPSFYPALFASIADLLEAFGVMVFERIRSRAGDPGEEAARPSQGESSGVGEASIVLPGTEERHALPKGWTCEDVGPEARETCRNWFYKTACIRELLPRVLIEAALLPCYRFLANEDEFGQILGRLSTLVRGVGDPMVAVFCSCFISAAGAKIAPRETTHAVASLQDYLFSLQEVQQGKLDGFLRANRLGLPEYLHLHTPAVDWLLGVVGPGAPRAVFTSILTHYRNYCGSLEVLRLILVHFSAEHYAPFALDMGLLIKQGRGFSTRCTAAEVMGLLGRKLGGAKATQIPGPDAVPLLNEAWQEIAPAPLEVYMEGATAWLGVLIRSAAYGPDEVAILVENVACRIEEESPSGLAVVQGRLADGVVSALACAEDPSALQAAGEHVVKILAALDKNRRAQACLELLAAFLRALPEPAPTRRTGFFRSSLPRPPTSSPPPAAPSLKSSPPEGDKGASEGSGGDGSGSRAGKGADTSEAALARALVGVAKLLHDSLDLLSSGERQRQSAVELTCDMVDRVGRGWEQPAEHASSEPPGEEKAGSRGGGGAADDGGGTGEGSRLAVLGDCRQAFWGMDEVTDRLVLAAVGLSVRAWRAGSDATARAALCFCSLTVPSVPSALRRLALLQLCGNTALQVGKPALADALFRSAICVVPECSPLVVSGGDSGGSSRGSGGLYPSPPPSDSGRKSYGAGGGGGGGGIAGLIGSGAWGPSPTGPGGVFGTDLRREHAGAWLLCDAVKGLLGALVAVPGHPDLGPFYLLRGLLKAVRRLPWPAGSGLLASIYITAAGMLCAMWQERLPYSVGAAARHAAALEDSRKENDAENDGDDSSRRSNGVAVATVAPALSGGGGGGSGESSRKAGASDESTAVAVGFPSPRPSLEGDSAVPEDKAAVNGDRESGGGGGGGGGPIAEGEEGGEGDDTAAAAAGDGSGHQAEDGAGPERKKSWLEVGGVLGTDDLYLRNSAFLEEVRVLLGDVVMATLRELEELWEQGEAEMASMIGDDHARAARLRYGRLTLDLANQLVSNVEMEGGAASVVTFLIEKAARAGARQTGGSSGRRRGPATAGGGGGGGGGGPGYFENTVAFVSAVAEMRLARLAKRRSDGVKAEQQEEACLSLSQGLSGFCAPSS